METKEKHFHIVLFPWLAFGHIIPFLELSKSLASKGNGDIQISFISTPSIIKRLSPIYPPSLKNNLPANCEATIDLKDEEQIQYLKIAYDLLPGPVEILLKNQIKLDLIICDVINCWMPEIGAKLHIPTALFSVSYAPSLAFFGPPSAFKESNSSRSPEYLTSLPEWIPFPSSLAYRYHEAVSMNEILNTKDATGLSASDRLAKVIEGCNFVLLKSCTEFDGDYFNLLKDLYQKPVIPIGLLPPPPAQVSLVKNIISHSRKSSNSEMFSWLDKQQPKTVVYVSFGSEYKMSIDEIHELAFGLETSKLPFLWVLRKPEGIDESNLLPSGLEDRIRGRGFMFFGWISQVEVLANAAIGGSLCHCGSSSISENLFFGHSQILMPMIIDQGINARFLVEKGLGFEVEKKEDGSFTRDAVAKAMRIVMVEQEGEQIRQKTTEMSKNIFSNHDLHGNYIQKFICSLGQLLSKE
ncbi:hypothetical protein MKX03_027030 [Papaver bracteatum]|nr:hypothetical protein MKX03_027030 [Papaver bracteatum]